MSDLLTKRIRKIVRVKPQLPRASGPITRVRFFSLCSEGVETTGDVVLRDGRLIAEPPDSIALNNVLAEPAMLYQTEERIFIDPKSQPEAFLKALPIMYHGSYFWAGNVED